MLVSHRAPAHIPSPRFSTSLSVQPWPATNSVNQQRQLQSRCSIGLGERRHRRRRRTTTMTTRAGLVKARASFHQPPPPPLSPLRVNSIQASGFGRVLLLLQARSARPERVEPPQYTEERVCVRERVRGKKARPNELFESQSCSKARAVRKPNVFESQTCSKARAIREQVIRQRSSHLHCYMLRCPTRC